MTKKEILNYLKLYTFIKANAKINNDDSITLIINLGAKVEKKLSKTDLILQKLNKIESDVAELKQDVKILKREATKYGWDLTPDKE